MGKRERHKRVSGPIRAIQLREQCQFDSRGADGHRSLVLKTVSGGLGRCQFVCLCGDIGVSLLLSNMSMAFISAFTNSTADDRDIRK